MAMLYVFYQGQQRSPDDGRLWWQAFDGTWHGVQEIYLGGDKNMSYAPAPVVFKNIIHVLHQGAYENGQLWLTWYDANVWNPDVQVPGVGLSWSPSAVVFNNQLYVFHPGSGESGELWYIFADATTWSDDRKLISGGDRFNVENGISLSPSAVVWNNMLYVFFQNGHGGGGIGNPGNGGLFVIGSSDGTNWWGIDNSQQPNTQLQNVGMSFSPSAVVWRNMIHVFHQGLGQNQQLWVSYHDGQNWQPDQQVPGVVIGNPPDAEHAFGGVAPMSPSAVVYNNNCYVFYLNQNQMLSYKISDGTGWSQETQVPDVPSQCGWAGCVVY